MENEGGARLVVTESSSQASDLASLNLTGSKGLESCSHNNDRQGYATTSEHEHSKPRDGIRDEWRNLEVSYSEIRDITYNFNESLVIGRGGFGKVYQAKLDGRTVAIKILDSTSTQGEREFFQEIQVLYKMQHPNLVKLVRACFKEVRALVYEYLPNGSLEDCLEESPKTLTWQLRTRIIYEICLALSYLHSKSVIHADLKPANVLLDANFKSKLSDFGLCRFLPEDMATGRFLETSPMGTPGYTDPWFLDRCILRPGSDLYSLGITVLKLLTGMSPIGLAWKISQTDKNSLPKMIDPTAGNWPSEMTEEMVYWSLQCCYHNENSSEVLMNMSTGLLGMLDEIETLQGGKFKPRKTIQAGSGGLEPSSRNEDKNEVMGSTNPSSSSSFSEPQLLTQDGLSASEPPTPTIDTQPILPRQTIQAGSGGLEPSSRNEDKNEIMGSSNPSSSSSFSEVEERDGEKLVRFHGGPIVFRLDDELSATTTRTFMATCDYWTLEMLTLKDGNKVVLKTILYRIVKERMEFEKEANALEKIRHPNLLDVRGYYLREDISKKSLVFDFMPKGSLFTCLQYGGAKIDWPTRMNIAMGIARGLDYIHNDMKVIHGDLTSDNIFLDDNSNAKIFDYEVSRLIKAQTQSIQNIRSARSLAYRAPELSSGIEKANTNSDVYSLGVILLELLTGKVENILSLMRVVDLPKWAASTMKAEGPRSVLDRDLVSDALGVTNEQVATLLLALDCVKYSPRERPEVKQVLHKLEEMNPDIDGNVDAAATSYSAPRPRRRWWWQRRG